MTIKEWKDNQQLYWRFVGPKNDRLICATAYQGAIARA